MDLRKPKSALDPVTCCEMVDFIRKNQDTTEITIPGNIESVGDWRWITGITARANIVVLKCGPVNAQNVIAPLEVADVLSCYPDWDLAILIENNIYLFMNYKIVANKNNPNGGPNILYLGYPRTSLEYCCSVDWLGAV